MSPYRLGLLRCGGRSLTKTGKSVLAIRAIEKSGERGEGGGGGRPKSKRGGGGPLESFKRGREKSAAFGSALER